MAKTARRTTTPRQDKVIALMVENGMSIGETKSKAEIMELAGYSNAIQAVPSKVLDSPTIQNKLKPFLEKLEEKKNLAIDNLTARKLKKAGARDVMGVADLLIKNTQLLGGGATERIEISAQERQAVDEAFKDNTIPGELIK